MFDYLKPVPLEGRTIRDVYNDVCEGLGKTRYSTAGMDYFSMDMGTEDQPFPDNYHWIACFPVTGGSEGHYIHVDMICSDMNGEHRKSLFLGKTFLGLGHAIEIAGKLARLMGV